MSCANKCQLKDILNFVFEVNKIYIILGFVYYEVNCGL